MYRCLQLAENGLGMVAPNPMVGAVIVHDGRIIGEGFHQRWGEAHAEVNAIQDALKNHPPEIFKESTLYVSLEPCSHSGKTPPCADLIIKFGFKKTVIACEDPFVQVRGTGIKKLIGAGVDVSTGILEKEATELNKRFMTYHRKSRPYIILKFAQSKDRFIAAEKPNATNRWISNIYSRKLVHRWRAEEQAVMVGKKTAMTDDPSLTLREWPGRQPLRIVLDPDLNLPGTLNLFDQRVPTLVLNGIRDESRPNLEFVRIDMQKPVIGQINEVLYQRTVQSIIVEGGAALLQSFIDSACWDEARVFTGDVILGRGLSSPVFEATRISEVKIDQDLLEIFKP